MLLEEQVGDQQKALEKTQYSNSHQDNYKRHLEEELSAVKRVGGGCCQLFFFYFSSFFFLLLPLLFSLLSLFLLLLLLLLASINYGAYKDQDVTFTVFDIYFVPSGE